MTNHGISDLHMHLNGSYSLSFLEKTAIKNKVDSVFLELVETKAAYKKLLIEESSLGFRDKSISLIWKQFSLKHGMVKKNIMLIILFMEKFG